MPKMTTTAYTRSTNSMTLLAADGRQARVGVFGFTQVQFGALADAIGNASNAAVIQVQHNSVVQDNPPERLVFDEAYQSAVVKATIIFQDAGRVTRKLSFPAPDASIFLSDGVSIDFTNPLVIAITDAFAAGAAGFVPVRGYLASRTRRTRSRSIAPALTEPTSGELPPPAPGA